MSSPLILFLVVVSSYLCFIEQSTAFLHSSGFSGPSLSRRMEMHLKRWTPKEKGHFFCIKRAKSETWISGICLCLNHYCLYQLTHSVKFMCSLPRFPLLSMQVEHFRQGTHIASKGECRKRTLDQTFSILASCSAINKISWGGGGGVGEKHY